MTVSNDRQRKLELIGLDPGKYSMPLLMSISTAKLSYTMQYYRQNLFFLFLSAPPHPTGKVTHFKGDRALERVCDLSLCTAFGGSQLLTFTYRHLSKEDALIVGIFGFLLF